MLLKELIHFPESRPHSGDFVLRLSEGVEHAQATIDSYVATPQLVSCFEQALGLVKSALEQKVSKGTYLHGSFGSGKSHFMAILHLLLSQDKHALGLRELAPVVAKYNPFFQGKKFLLVPLHMIGAESLESAILVGYDKQVNSLPPEIRAKAGRPAIYAADRLFEDAEGLRGHMGDEKFFAGLNSRSNDAASGGWGKLAASWTAPRYQEALAASPGEALRSELVGALVDSYFSSMAHVSRVSGVGRTAENQSVLAIDEGLSEISRHAERLGYDGLIIFLDEVVLWLASNAQNTEFISRECPKLAKLVEAQNAARPVPIVSFLARQRDLREILGPAVDGATKLNWLDTMNWWEGRFETIRLEDRNLPVILEKRLLRPRSPEAKEKIDREFEEILDSIKHSGNPAALSTLLTTQGNRSEFRQVYPFSPALVETLVGVSSLLQRERTALKILSQILFESRDSLRLGDIVPVGDLFDLVSEGDQAFSEAMKHRLERARKLLHEKFLPLLERQTGKRREKFAELPPDSPEAQGIKADLRLFKTLLLSALAEGVESLRGLTCTRLAELNHGSIKAPIPGQEHVTVLRKVQTWQAEIGEIRISEDQRNPVISLKLSGVDTDSILEKVQAEDNPGNRQRFLKGLLREELGLSDQNSGILPSYSYEFLWRGTRREVSLEFANVRETTDDRLLRTGEEEWRVVIDLPVDQPGITPREDIQRLERFRDKQQPLKTVFWLPNFFSAQMLGELGKVVLIEYLLKRDCLESHAGHLSRLDQTEARQILESQFEQLRQRVRKALGQAYGLDSAEAGVLDQTYLLEPDKQFVTLWSALELRRPAATKLKDGLDKLCAQALDSDYPDHPIFEDEFLGRPADLLKLRDWIAKAAQAENKRVLVDKAERRLLRSIAQPLKLGEMGETHFVLGSYWSRHFDKHLAASGLGEKALTVQKLRAWVDEPRPLGLPLTLVDLLIFAYKQTTNRTFFRSGIPWTPGEKDSVYPAEVELRAEELPSREDWEKALDRGGALWGIAGTKSLLNADTLSAFCAQVAERLDNDRKSCLSLKAALESAFQEMGIADGAEGKRSKEVEELSGLLRALGEVDTRKSGGYKSLLETLAQFRLLSAPQALGVCLKQAPETTRAINSANWEMFTNLKLLPEGFQLKGEALIAELCESLNTPEFQRSLRNSLERLNCSVNQLMREVLLTSASQTSAVSSGAPRAADLAAALGSAGAILSPDQERAREHCANSLRAPLRGSYNRLKLSEAQEVVRSLERTLADEAAQPGADSNQVAVNLTWEVIRR